jgi:fatty-acyl-CoA synthase
MNTGFAKPQFAQVCERECVKVVLHDSEFSGLLDALPADLPRDQRIDGANKRGRIFIRSGAPFQGYSDGRHKQIIDGYMSSGDMGHFDENGLLFVDGRDDDMIVSGGENVFPQEVENLLVEREDVSDAALVGVDDSEFGKRLRAFIVSQPGAPQDIEDIKLHVKNNLARHKVPRDVVFIDELPRNATGKLLRRVLTEMDVDR